MKPGTEETPKTVRRVRLHEEIVAQIRELIERGELKSGDRLPAERRLAEIFRVSRHSVREAIRALEQQQIVTSRLGDGTYVLEKKEEQVIEPLATALEKCRGKLAEVLELRKLIEPQIASLAARHVTDAQLAGLRAQLDVQIAEIRGGNSGSEADCEFHKLIAAATGNSVLLEMVSRIHDLVEESRDFTLQNDHRRDWAIETHERILKALQERDPDAAFREMHDHIAYVEQLALKELGH
ncbi:FadR/GntR family transcriptional regulator [Desulfovibrio psychrotolerans]|uniref:GntR family transcriptional regulator n=1 Tax=Desulfovibrio psychrotolerans TaxID=415242 RepID=A0A7J0BU96_9BACT|nr:FadR/GntR family transcriptional regulator [Desulfovibrio psychrotolerans]GFM36715.1 GntR family transcriptional regulator [Desulfovibrio psychrotolerans]